MDVFAGLVKHFQSNKCVKEYEAHSGKVHSIAWNCDGTKLASGSLDKTVSIFRLEKDRLVNYRSFVLCLGLSLLIFTY